MHPADALKNPPKPSRVVSRGVGNKLDQAMSVSIQQQYWKDHPELAQANPGALRAAYLEDGGGPISIYLSIYPCMHWVNREKQRLPR